MIPIHEQITRPMTRCEFAATTTAILMATMAVAGTAVSAYGSYAAGQAQKAAADYNSQVAMNNAKAQEQQTNEEAKRIQSNAQRVTGAQRAQAAAAGLDPNTGSSTDIQYDSRVQAELDALTARYKGGIAGMNQRAQAALDTAGGQNAATAGMFNAGGTILSGGGQAFYNYETIMNNPGFRQGHG